VTCSGPGAAAEAKHSPALGIMKPYWAGAESDLGLPVHLLRYDATFYLTRGQPFDGRLAP
jgi:hypothetical protein